MSESESLRLCLCVGSLQESTPGQGCHSLALHMNMTSSLAHSLCISAPQRRHTHGDSGMGSDSMGRAVPAPACHHQPRRSHRTPNTAPLALLPLAQVLPLPAAVRRAPDAVWCRWATRGHWLLTPYRLGLADGHSSGLCACLAVLLGMLPPWSARRLSSLELVSCPPAIAIKRYLATGDGSLSRSRLFDC